MTPLDRLKAVVSVAVVLLVPSLAAAQGSRSAGPSGNEFQSLDSFDVFRSVAGVLLEVNEPENVLAVQVGPKEDERVSFKLGAKIRLTADKKSALGGRRTLQLADFASGQPVKITYRATDKSVIEMRLLRSPSR